MREQPENLFNIYSFSLKFEYVSLYFLGQILLLTASFKPSKLHVYQIPSLLV